MAVLSIKEAKVKLSATRVLNKVLHLTSVNVVDYHFNIHGVDKEEADRQFKLWLQLEATIQNYLLDADDSIEETIKVLKAKGG